MALMVAKGEMARLRVSVFLEVCGGQLGERFSVSGGQENAGNAWNLMLKW